MKNAWWAICYIVNGQTNAFKNSQQEQVMPLYNVHLDYLKASRQI